MSSVAGSRGSQPQAASRERHSTAGSAPISRNSDDQPVAPQRASAASTMAAEV
jgi:hypothetical protein